jgi:hypothetical protein
MDDEAERSNLKVFSEICWRRGRKHPQFGEASIADRPGFETFRIAAFGILCIMFEVTKNRAFVWYLSPVFKSVRCSALKLSQPVSLPAGPWSVVESFPICAGYSSRKKRCLPRGNFSCKIT